MIREAAVSDALGIARAHVLSWQSAYRGLVPDEHLDGLSVERRATFWTGVIADAPSRGQQLWVAEDDTIHGFACVGPTRDQDDDPTMVGELQAVYLLPSAWGLGIGRALHDTGMSWLRARGNAEATLWVLESNERGRAFYERQGWRADGANKHEVWDGTPMDEIRLRRPL